MSTNKNQYLSWEKRRRGSDLKKYNKNLELSLEDKIKQPEIWGPHLWHFLHTFAASVPEVIEDEERRDAIKEFIEALPFVLPCQTCAVHYDKMLDDYPVTPQVLATRKSLSAYIFFLHNTVNARLGKPVLPAKIILDKYGVSISD